MHKHLNLARCLQRHRVTGCMLLDNLARTWCAQNIFRRIDGDSVTSKRLGKDRVGHALERIKHTGNRCQEHKFAESVQALSSSGVLSATLKSVDRHKLPRSTTGEHLKRRSIPPQL